MIPKIIHYCWFGGNPLPEDTKKYIETWKKYCPDFKIIQWDETNFDLEYCDYVREAYKAKKWAFVSDVARLYALVNYGGVYMDTDVEVCKNFSEFLKHSAFSGFERVNAIPTAIMACEKNFPLFKDLLEEYNTRSFINKDGSYNTTTNVEYITNRCLKSGLKLNNTFQTVEGFALYPKDYFCPKDYLNGQIYKTSNTYTIHHFSGSWLTPKEIKWVNIKHKICEKIGKEKAENLFDNRLFQTISVFSQYGLKETVKRIKGKLENKK